MEPGLKIIEESDDTFSFQMVGENEKIILEGGGYSSEDEIEVLCTDLKEFLIKYY